MKIRFTKAWRRGVKPGQVAEIPDGVANMLIRQGKAEPHESVPIKEVRSDIARAKFAAKLSAKEHDETEIPESTQQQQAGRRGGSKRQPGKQAVVAADC